MFAIAQGLPGSQLTPEYRGGQLYLQDWHRETDDQIDRQLDILFGSHIAESAQQLKSFPHHPKVPTAMADGDSVNDMAATSAVLQDVAGGNHHSGLVKAKGSPLSSYDSNEFDNPDFQTPRMNHALPALEKSYSSSPAEMKQELAATVALTPDTAAIELNAHTAPNVVEGSQPIQRVPTEPTGHSSTFWQSDNSEGSPFSNTMPYPVHAMHQVASATSDRTLHQRSTPSMRPRFAFEHYHQPVYGSAHSGVGQHQYNQPFHGEPRHYEAGINNSTYNQVLGASTIGRMNNHSHLVNTQPIQHNNVDSPSVFQSRNDHILKSQPSSESRGSAHSGSTQPRGARSRLSHSEMAQNEAIELKDCADLIYKTVEAARQAEFPKFKVSGKRDVSIPETDLDKQRYVVRLVRSMNISARAQDNPGMVNQWEKLKQDAPRVEQAAWRLLDLTLQLHLYGTPIVANRQTCMKYGTMTERWDAICTGLQRVTNNRKVNSNKKIHYDNGRRGVHHNGVGGLDRQDSPESRPGDPSGHIDDSDYGDPNIGDPYFGGSPGPYGPLADEDAEGDVDEDYVNPTPAARASSTSRRPKRERETEDDEYGIRGKKSRRISAKDLSTHYPVAPKRQIKNARKKTPGWNSRLQVIDHIMRDLEDETNEDIVYSRGSSRQKEIYEKIHYPDGRPASRNEGYNQNGHLPSASSSHRAARAAAPLSFAGQDNSDETEGSYTDNKTAEADDFYQN
ncbi:MAG: hypothetical protein Q9182_001586 [Xanthomendoza sp. 2 TL-2023]